ncbi:hypothetical protein [Streptomyces showdoensis]|uniref:hypothetical protein n=1 Tax=Streptomyces showdoensis TaxID=68268 RepID=UPI00103CC3EA|nr:hypothetical protein [Streptomyces showdoensis]
MGFESIAAIDWSSFPRPWRPHPPRDVAAQLQALAEAATLNQAAGAMTALLDSALIDDLEREVQPAAVAAAPVLLDIIERGHPRARSAAIDLLWEILGLPPASEFSRVDATQTAGFRLCCAIADHIRDRQSMLRGHGPSGQELLRATDRHWWFTVEEVVAADGKDVTVFGTLTGRLPKRSCEAELHSGRTIVAVPAAEAEYGGADEDGAAFLRLSGTARSAVAPGAVLRPTDCAANQG